MELLICLFAYVVFPYAAGLTAARIHRGVF